MTQEPSVRAEGGRRQGRGPEHVLSITDLGIEVRAGGTRRPKKASWLCQDRKRSPHLWSRELGTRLSCPGSSYHGGVRLPPGPSWGWVGCPCLFPPLQELEHGFHQRL